MKFYTEWVFCCVTLIPWRQTQLSPFVVISQLFVNPLQNLCFKSISPAPFKPLFHQSNSIISPHFQTLWYNSQLFLSFSKPLMLSSLNRSPTFKTFDICVLISPPFKESGDLFKRGLMGILKSMLFTIFSSCEVLGKLFTLVACSQNLARGGCYTLWYKTSRGYCIRGVSGRKWTLERKLRVFKMSGFSHILSACFHHFFDGYLIISFDIPHFIYKLLWSFSHFLWICCWPQPRGEWLQYRSLYLWQFSYFYPWRSPPYLWIPRICLALFSKDSTGARTPVQLFFKNQTAELHIWPFWIFCFLFMFSYKVWQPLSLQEVNDFRF